MTAALAVGRHDDMPRVAAPAPIVLRAEDSLQRMFAPIRGISAIMLAVLAGSVALHLAVLATAVVTARVTTVMPRQEISVEVVQEVPKAPTKQAHQQAPAKSQAPPAARLDVPKTAPVVPPKPQVAPAAPAKPAAIDERETLRKEIEALKAEQARLKSAETPAQPLAANLGMGPLPNSFQAVALPSTGEGVGEAMAFEDIVFSQLAKAKGLGQRQGVPGTTGVRFQIDAAGGLASVEIVHPSGSVVLDREALDIVHRAAPFPPPPAGARRSFVANVNFVPRDDR